MARNKLMVTVWILGVNRENVSPHKTKIPHLGTIRVMNSPSSHVAKVKLNDGFYELATKDAIIASVSILQEFHDKLDFQKIETLQTKGLRLFGIVQESRLIAVASVTCQLHLTEGSRPWIEDLIVVPEFRDQGVGGALLQEVLKALCNEGAETVLIRTRQENVGAQRFYMANGATPAGPTYKWESSN